MALIAWNSLVIAVRQDLKRTLPNFDTIAQVSGQTDQEARLTDTLIDAKSELFTDLQQVIPDIYAYSKTLYAGYGLTDDWIEWFNAQGHNWDTIDGIMDVIFNPSVLKDTLVGCWKWKLYSVQAEDMLIYDQTTIENYTKMRDHWESLYHTRYEKAWRLLQFDLNKDGKIQPGERTRTQNTIRIR
ncbi:MAG TPA: hypothetical protein VGM92_08795 [Candidatus Kapabacteria bacterium]|jgi:hypothetical protein